MSRGKIGEKIKDDNLKADYPWLDLRFSSFLEFIFSLSSIEQASIFLNYFFTDYEIQAFLQRWHILIYLITTDLTYKEIASFLGCSTRTVGRVAKEVYANLPDELQKLLKVFLYPRERSIEEENIKAKIRILKKIKGGSFWASLLKKQLKNKRPWWENLMDSSLSKKRIKAGLK